MKWFNGTGWEYIDYLKQYPSTQGKKFIGFRHTKNKGFEVIIQDNEIGHFWIINELMDDFRMVEEDWKVFRTMNMNSFKFYDN